jgi:uncharacterized protein YbaR (Trm112 family)
MNAVIEVRCGQHERTHNSEQSVGGETKVVVRHRCSDRQYQHANGTRSYDFCIAVVPVTEPKCDKTEGQHNDQHLRMQMPFRKLRKKRQASHYQRQRQAVNEAQGRQPNRCAIEPVGRLRHTLIHREMPLSYQRDEENMDKRLLAILRCPVTHKELSLASGTTLKGVNAAIGGGTLSNRDGHVLDQPLDEGLVTDDGKVLYPIVNGIPVLLEGESINMEQLG